METVITDLEYDYIGPKAANDKLLRRIKKLQDPQDKKILELSREDIFPIIDYFKYVFRFSLSIGHLDINLLNDYEVEDYQYLSYAKLNEFVLLYSHDEAKSKGYKEELDISDTLFTDLLYNSDEIELNKRKAEMSGQKIQLQELINNWSKDPWGCERQALVVYRLLVAYVLLEYIAEISRSDNAFTNPLMMEARSDNDIENCEKKFYHQLEWKKVDQNFKYMLYGMRNQTIKALVDCVPELMAQVRQFLSKELPNEAVVVSCALKRFRIKEEYTRPLSWAQSAHRQKDYYGADQKRLKERLDKLFAKSPDVLTEDELSYILKHCLNKVRDDLRDDYIRKAIEAQKKLRQEPVAGQETKVNRAIEGINKDAQAAEAKQASENTEQFASMKELGSNLPQQESSKGLQYRQTQPTGGIDNAPDQAATTSLARSSIKSALKHKEGKNKNI